MQEQALRTTEDVDSMRKLHFESVQVAGWSQYLNCSVVNLDVSILKPHPFVTLPLFCHCYIAQVEESKRVHLQEDLDQMCLSLRAQTQRADDAEGNLAVARQQCEAAVLAHQNAERQVHH